MDKVEKPDFYDLACEALQGVEFWDEQSMMKAIYQVSKKLEQSSLRERQAASEAWEAAADYEYSSNFGKIPTRFPDKETYLNERFSKSA